MRLFPHFFVFMNIELLSHLMPIKSMVSHCTQVHVTNINLLKTKAWKESVVFYKPYIWGLALPCTDVLWVSWLMIQFHAVQQYDSKKNERIFIVIKLDSKIVFFFLADLSLNFFFFLLKLKIVYGFTFICIWSSYGEYPWIKYIRQTVEWYKERQQGVCT